MAKNKATKTTKVTNEDTRANATRRNGMVTRDYPISSVRVIYVERGSKTVSECDIVIPTYQTSKALVVRDAIREATANPDLEMTVIEIVTLAVQHNIYGIPQDKFREMANHLYTETELFVDEEKPEENVTEEGSEA